MQSELRNQTLVAAAAAKHQGFENLYNALIAIVKEMDAKQDAPTSLKAFSNTYPISL